MTPPSASIGNWYTLQDAGWLAGELGAENHGKAVGGHVWSIYMER